MVTLYGINVCFYFYILRSHFSKVILTTEEVITAILKVISATTKVILANEEVIMHRNFKRYLSSWSDQSHFKSYLSHYTSDLGH